MLTIQQKAQCVLWYNKLKSPTAVQCKFRNEFGQDPPHTNSIKRWFKNFMETGSILDRKRSGRPSIDEETVDAVRVAFHRSPRKSIRVASNELAIPQSTVHKVLHKRLRLHAYKLQIVQALKPDDCPRRAAFAEEILQRIDDDNGYLNSVCFSDEATFHVSGKVNKHNIRIWGLQNPCEVLERERDSPKINVWCGLMHNQIIDPFIFAESTITANIYLDMLKHYVVPQLEEFQPRVVFQQDGAPPHWSLIVRDFLNETFPNRWIGRNGPTPWPPRSPDITPLDFFLWGYVKDRVYRTPVRDVETLQSRIIEVLATVNEEMLENTWREIEYRLDILRATNGAHVKGYE